MLTGVRSITGGRYNTCARSNTGGVQCWGDNNTGLLGDGTSTKRSSPTAVVLTGVQSIATGATNTCALTVSGGVRGWGRGLTGELWDGTKMDAWLTPPASDVLGGAMAVTTGLCFACALTKAGGVRCWGDPSYGKLGRDVPAGRMTPPKSDTLSGVKMISTKAQHTCALMNNGDVRCWGSNSQGQLGDGTMIDRSTPTCVKWEQSK